MIDEKILMQLDKNNAKLKEIFKNDIKLKEVHIDIYSINPLISTSIPFMLFLRTIEKNMIVKNNGIRLILTKNINGYNTRFMDVLLSEIKECRYNCNSNYFEFILNIQNIYYRLTVFK